MKRFFLPSACWLCFSALAAYGWKTDPPKRAEFLKGLNSKAATAPLPVVPENQVLAWAREREQKVAPEQDAIRAMLVENARIAGNLLGENTPTQRRQGLRLAQFSARVAFDRVQDRRVAARFYELWILPYLRASHSERWQDLSRQRLLEEALGAFKRADEPRHIELTLRKLLGEKLNPNARDFARAELTQLLATRAQWKEAIALLEAVDSPSMTGVKNLLPHYREKLQAQNSAKP